MEFIINVPLAQKTIPCEMQKENPDGRAYQSASLIVFTTPKSYCGILPLNSKNYWVYQDSIFAAGVFVKVQLDTLRYEKSMKSLNDGLIWWEGNLEIGLPDILFANDSAFFSLENRLFEQGVKEVKKDYSLFNGDSVLYLAHFEDAAAMGRSVKMKTNITTPAGTFSDCVFFEKYARNYRRDQVYFKPGIGVVKYINEEAPMGEQDVKIMKISTLVSFHMQ